MKIAGALEKNSTMKCINLANNHIKVRAPVFPTFEDSVAKLIIHVALPDERRKCSCQSSSRPRSREPRFCCCLAHLFSVLAGSKSCTIRKLNLSNNSIGYQGASHIAEVLASAETLEELNLSGISPCSNAFN